MWLPLLFTSAILLQLVVSSEFLNTECSVAAILRGEREETELCNLRSLLRRPMTVESESEVVKRAWPWPRLEKKVIFGLQSCSGAGAVCRVNGKRTCICPKSFVCDPEGIPMIHSCVKLTYFVHQE